MIMCIVLFSLPGEVVQEPVLAEVCHLLPDPHHSIPYPIPYQ